MLTVETLGGAGFASQRTGGDDRMWNLCSCEGITLTLGKADKKKYTFVLKYEILPPSENGREQTLSPTSMISTSKRSVPQRRQPRSSYRGIS
jgi:Complex I intermediate-associated protein 30 (CIA30)